MLLSQPLSGVRTPRWGDANVVKFWGEIISLSSHVDITVNLPCTPDRQVYLSHRADQLHIAILDLQENILRYSTW